MSPSQFSFKLRIDNSTSKQEQFQKIQSLSSYNIKNAFDGYDHSLFQTDDGMILAFGQNKYGSLLFEDSSLPEVISKPTKTVVGKYASFAIDGAFLSAVFFGCQAPANMPNKNVPDNMKLELAKLGSTISFANTAGNEPNNWKL